MAVFAIILQPGDNNANLPDAVRSAFPNRFRALPGGHWLISANSSAQEISDLLGISDGRNGAALVVELAAYFGRANPDIWTWLRANWG